LMRDGGNRPAPDWGPPPVPRPRVTAGRDDAKRGIRVAQRRVASRSERGSRDAGPSASIREVAMTSKRAAGLLAGLALPMWLALAGEARAADEKLVVGLSLPETLYPLFGDMAKAAQQEADALGVKLDLTDARFSDTRQEIDLDGLVQRRVDGIIVCPFYTGSTLPAIEDTAATGIPVVELFSPPTSDKVLFALEADVATAGRMVARFVIESLHGGGSALVLEPTGSPSTFRDAFERELQGSKVKVLASASSAPTGGSGAAMPSDPAITALIRGHPKFDAVISMSDVLLFRAVRAMEEAGIDPTTKVTVGGGAVPDTLLAIKQGKISASVDPRSGEAARQAVRYLVEYLRTKKMPPNRDILVAPELVTGAASRD
jgi:ribose transport system substrate-binding protein